MFGFLFKILVIAVIVAGVGGYVALRRGSLPALPKNLSDITSQIKLPGIPGVLGSVKQIDPQQAGERISAALDALVTHPGRNAGPVILGVQVTNDSITTLTDVLLNLPNDQLEQVRQTMCASPSAR